MLFRACDGHRSGDVPAIYSFLSSAVSPPLPPDPSTPAPRPNPSFSETLPPYAYFPDEGPHTLLPADNSQPVQIRRLTLTPTPATQPRRLTPPRPPPPLTDADIRAIQDRATRERALARMPAPPSPADTEIQPRRLTPPRPPPPLTEADIRAIQDRARARAAHAHAQLEILNNSGNGLPAGATTRVLQVGRRDEDDAERRFVVEYQRRRMEMAMANPPGGDSDVVPGSRSRGG